MESDDLELIGVVVVNCWLNWRKALEDGEIRVVVIGGGGRIVGEGGEK